MCPHGQRGKRNFWTKREGGKFLRFCADVFFGWPLKFNNFFLFCQNNHIRLLKQFMRLIVLARVFIKVPIENIKNRLGWMVARVLFKVPIKNIKNRPWVLFCWMFWMDLFDEQIYFMLRFCKWRSYVMIGDHNVIAGMRFMPVKFQSDFLIDNQ